jgi:SAM-dependent MidA family methyltransferase
MERLDAFMARANAAYYATQDPFSDFTTAPEIGQVFGELLGAWAAVVWGQMGAPDPVFLAEAGPGRGTLMADALRAVGRVAPAFRRVLQVHFIETSPRLRAIQAASVPRAIWHHDLATLPPGPIILLANEFLDALPIRQFERRGGTWHERHVEAGAFALAPSVRHWPGPDGSVVEACEAAEAWAGTLATRLLRDGGAALLLDYGGGQGDTLQALRHGSRADPLADPGEADLTAHVDFPGVLRAAATRGAACWGPVAQGDLLMRLGLGQRTAALVRTNPARKAALEDAFARLAAPDRMGTLFKAAAITHPGLPTPPGFEQ